MVSSYSYGAFLSTEVLQTYIWMPKQFKPKQSSCSIHPFTLRLLQSRISVPPPGCNSACAEWQQEQWACQKWPSKKRGYNNLAPMILTLMSPMENSLCNAEETQRNQILSCVVFCSHPYKNQQQRYALWLLCLLLQPQVFLHFHRYARDEKVWPCLHSSGALFGTFCITWCLLLSSKYCWTGRANIIGPPAKPAPSLFQ